MFSTTVTNLIIVNHMAIAMANAKLRRDTVVGFNTTFAHDRRFSIN
jgi:hypothetical protein